MIPLRSPQEAERPTAVALGSFDGLHGGHRRVIAAISGAGDPAAEAVPTVVSFWPHPREVLHGDVRLRLDMPSEKLALLGPLGVRQLVLVPFTLPLSRLSPEEFVDGVLRDQLQARRVAVGENFRFGARRCGDAATLERIGRARGIAVQVVPMLRDGGERLSSSRIRRALAAGDLVEAGRLLQRPYRFSGPVVRGRGLGRGLGWPTANLAVDGRKFLPGHGVYAAWVWADAPPAGPAGGPLPAVMNLGPQPTIDPASPSSVEVHILDRDLDLSRSRLTVEPVERLRGQVRFESVEALSRQIAADAARAAARLGGVAAPTCQAAG